MSALPTRDLDVALGEAYAELQAQIARTDTKASILLAAIGAGLAVLGTTGTAMTLPLVGGIAAGLSAAALAGAAGLSAAALAGAAGLSAAALAGAAGLLLAVIRPRLLHSGPGTSCAGPPPPRRSSAPTSPRTTGRRSAPPWPASPWPSTGAFSARSTASARPAPCSPWRP